MKEIHRKLAEISLAASDKYGFVLAGGYALSANGIGDRPSDDADFFTNVMEPESFRQATEEIIAALQQADFQVEVRSQAVLYAKLNVRYVPTGEETTMDLGVDHRNYLPNQLEVGPVLDLRDAVASKLGALWSRGEARDFIDVHQIVQSGRFSQAELLKIGDQLEVEPLDRQMLTSRFREASIIPDKEFEYYQVHQSQIGQLKSFYSEWAAAIDPDAPKTSTIKAVKPGFPAARPTNGPSITAPDPIVGPQDGPSHQGPSLSE